MSAFTSLYISRSKARAVLMERIGQLSDSQLETFVNELTEPRLVHVVIDSESSGPDDDEFSQCALP